MPQLIASDKLGTNMLNIEGRENSISYLQQESSEGGHAHEELFLAFAHVLGGSASSSSGDAG